MIEDEFDLGTPGVCACCNRYGYGRDVAFEDERIIAFICDPCFFAKLICYAVHETRVDERNWSVEIIQIKQEGDSQ